MNMLSVVLTGFAAICAAVGFIKGFARMILPVFAAVAAAVVMWISLPVAKTAVQNGTQMEERIAQKVSSALWEKVKPNDGFEEQVSELELPDALKEGALEKYEEAAGALHEKVDAFGRHLAGIILTALLAAGIFLFVYVLIRVIALIRRKAGKEKELRKIDKLLGAAMGLLKAWIFISVIFLLITACVHTDFGGNLMVQISESRQLSWLYNHNLLLMIVKGVHGAAAL